jgi:hypothetical protein
MTDRYLDSQGVPIGGYDKSPPEANEIEWSAEYEAEYAAANEGARWRAERFYELAEFDYWLNIDIAKRYHAMARSFRTRGHEHQAGMYEAVAVAASDYVRRKKNALNERIAIEWAARDG